MSAPVLLERRGPVAVVTLNRPQSLNAFDLELINALRDQLLAVAFDPSVRAIVLAGAGKAFCAGGNLKWMLEFPGGPAAGIHRLAAVFHQCIIELRRCPRPVIAAVNGFAAGGGFSLALACDFRVLGRGAQLKFAYGSAGLAPDGGSTFSLPRLVGVARALELAATDEPIDAERALAWGLATRVCDDDAELSTACRFAAELSERAVGAFGAAKQLFNETMSTPLESQLEQERRAIELSASSAEGREGLDAFTARRKPVFRGA
jgi:2-(1,2-epoxy-1,2-dihydrophenyl)acetyl-CoA isomerase